MAKKKPVNEDDIFAEIAQDTGGDVLGQLDNCKFFIDTGNLAVNYICSGKFINGGIPGQRITEVYGPSASGKSLYASNILFGCQKLNGWAVLLDCENASNAEWMEKASHLNTNRVLRYTPYTLEAAFLQISETVKKLRAYEKKEKMDRRPIVVVYDSISVSPCEREYRETELPKDYKPSDWKKIVGAKEQPGERAKVCSKELRKLQPMLEKEDVTVVVINQTRDKIGVLYGSPETTAGGGNSLPFYASCRIRTQQQKKIEHKKLKSYCGINMKVQNIKNRAFRPFVKHENIKLYFDTGINPVTGLLSALLEEEAIIKSSGGNYKVAADYLPEGKKEYKFKSSQERNDVPIELLLDCPSLIGASTKEEVIDYLAPFEAAINYTNSDNFTEKKIAFDIDGNPLDDEDYDFEDEDEESEEEENDE